MKNIYLLLFILIGFGLTSCVREEGEGDASAETAVVEESNPDDLLGGGVPLSTEGKRVVENLTNNSFWYVEHWHKVIPGEGRDNAAYEANRGRWFQFKKDGTFTHGQLLETVGTGTWSYNSDSKAVKMLSVEKKYNEEFAVDLHSQGGMMSWTSTKRFNSANVMALLEEYVELMAELP